MGGMRIKWLAAGGVAVSTGAATLALGAGPVNAEPGEASGPPIPATCTADVRSVLTGLGFAIDGQAVASLKDRPLGPGSRIDVTWSGVAPGCEDATITLALHETAQPWFDPTENQPLVGSASCAPALDCGDGSLGIDLPDATVAPCGQVDFVLGIEVPLVGPGGEYYGIGQARPRLIDHAFWGEEPCEREEPAVTAPDDEEETTDNGVGVLPEEVEAPITAPVVTVPAPPAAPAPTVPDSPPPAAPVVPAPAPVQVDTLPVTGASSNEPLRAAVLGVAAGLVFLVAARSAGNANRLRALVTRR